MATERSGDNPRLLAQGRVLKRWGQQWRKTHGKSQQDLGRAAGYGSDESPKSAAVAISRIESGKTDPSGTYRQRLLETLGHNEEDLEAAISLDLDSAPQGGAVLRALAGPLPAENDRRRARIVSESNLLTDRVDTQLQLAEKALERAHSGFIEPFLETAAKIDWQPVLDARPAGPVEPEIASRQDAIRGLREQTRVSVLRALTESAAGAVAGVGVGAGTAAGVFAAVSAAASASTGTAIASLSGAAASSATLAWLGGGSLAAGGLGIAGGTAVLTGIVALPTLLAMGGVLVWKGRMLRREASAESEKLDAAQQALEEMRAALPQAEEWNRSQITIIQRAELIGRTLHNRFAECVASSHRSPEADDHPIKWDSLTPATQKALTLQVTLLSMILDTRALPIWLAVTSVNKPELSPVEDRSSEESRYWVSESLILAQYELDEHEQWVRSLLAEDHRK